MTKLTRGSKTEANQKNNIFNSLVAVSHGKM